MKRDIDALNRSWMTGFLVGAMLPLVVTLTTVRSKIWEPKAFAEIDFPPRGYREYMLM